MNKSANYYGIIKAADTMIVREGSTPMTDNQVLALQAAGLGARLGTHGIMGALADKIMSDSDERRTWRDNATSSLGGALAGELVAQTLGKHLGLATFPAAWLASAVGGRGLNLLRRKYMPDGPDKEVKYNVNLSPEEYRKMLATNPNIA